jgi:NAD(P)-dependent dehydrogenase (short-subunit alcohol dehydrogenase family)
MVTSSTKGIPLSRIFITGSADGLGHGAAKELIAAGHEVVVHARSDERARTLRASLPGAAAVVTGDLASAAQTRALAAQVNAIGRMDGVIHNAGIYQEATRGSTPEGHARVLAVNTLAPYLLTALIERPGRLVYLSSGMHRSGEGSLRDIDWTARAWQSTQAYCESKLHLAALAAALALRWPQVRSHAVDPGWVPTRMGGASATDDLEMGHQTQTWLAVSDDAAARSSGGYWHHKQRQTPAAEVSDPVFQQRLLAKLEELTGVALP